MAPELKSAPLEFDFVCALLGMEPRTLNLLDKGSSTDRHPRPFSSFEKEDRIVILLLPRTAKEGDQRLMGSAGRGGFLCLSLHP